MSLPEQVPLGPAKMIRAGGHSSSSGLHIESCPPESPRQSPRDDYKEIDPMDAMSGKLDEKGDDERGWLEENIRLPQSSHSWIFTARLCSLPFWTAVGIVVISYTGLLLSFSNLLTEGEPGKLLGVPCQVNPSVRIAQYLAMIIALIMEEEIPQALFLLRHISKKSLLTEFPGFRFWRFILSAFIRLVMGYMFLINTFCVVAQADTVLGIFYDVLALQFLQQLDDITFQLAKMDVLGARLKHAALAKCFTRQFSKVPFALRKNKGKILKALYVLNLCVMLTGMAYITHEQVSGRFHPRSVSIAFGDQIWREAIVDNSSTGTIKRNLIFSYFNGVYKRTDGFSKDGRPVYIEQNKFTGAPYKYTVPGEIRYCSSEEAWVFVHPNISKIENRSKFPEEVECPWLIKSQRTEEYSLLDVTGEWTIWTGSVKRDNLFSVVDNECFGAVDCNFNGKCRSDGSCICDGGFFGTHCEHAPACPLITSGVGGTWATVNPKASGPHIPEELNKLGRPPNGFEVRIYERPMYQYRHGLNETTLQKYGVNNTADRVLLMYTGSRWFGTHFKGGKLENRTASYWRSYTTEFHAFWQNIYNDQTLFASDPTTQSSIIGLDFFSVGLKGEQYGPFGQLFPMSDPKGSGFFSCGNHSMPNSEHLNL